MADRRRDGAQGPWRPGATPPKPSQPTKVVAGRLSSARQGWSLKLADGRTVAVHVVADVHPKLLCGPGLLWDLRQAGTTVKATPVEGTTLDGIRSRAAEAAAPAPRPPSKKQEKAARRRAADGPPR